MAKFLLNLLLVTVLAAASARGGDGEPHFVIGDTLGGDPVLREAVVQWSAAHEGAFEIRALAPAALGDPANGCDAVLIDLDDGFRLAPGMTLLPYAVEAVVAAAAQDNPVTDISAGDLKRIYSGRIVNWRTLGGPDLAIVRAGVGANAPGERVFLRRVMNRKPFADGPVPPGDDILPGVIVCCKNAEAEVLARSVPGLILFGSPALARAAGLKLLSVNGVAPTRENIRSGKYPLTLTRRVCFRENGALGDFLRKLPDFLARRAAVAEDFLPPPGAEKPGK